VQLFKACEALGGVVIFLDELDSLATSRDRADMHEASRRLLGVLLREIDGFDNAAVEGGSSGAASGVASGQQQQQRGAASRRSVLIGATNRRQDLDAALLSRWVVGWQGRGSSTQLAVAVAGRQLSKAGRQLSTAQQL
jgi:SpoVK/Ycf46/Vps4 family AAA+-type ATPase